MKGIIMSGESVPGVLAGAKTQSRRTGVLEAVNEEPGRWRLWGPPHNGVWTFTDHSHQGEKGQIVRCKPRYQPGEVVYMKETFQLRQWCSEYEYYDWNGLLPSAGRDGWSVDYAADFDDPGEYKWRSPLYMPAWASRATLRIVRVRCEQLCHISYADALAEGIEDSGAAMTVERFARRWNEVNGRRYPWAGNWWVFVYEFCLLT